MARLKFKVSSLWMIWFCVIVFGFECYIVGTTLNEYTVYSSYNWIGERPNATLNIVLVFVIMAILCLPLFIVVSAFHVGNFANDGVKIGQDPSREVWLKTKQLGNAERFWRNFGPWAQVLHLISAFFLMLPRPLMEAELIKHGHILKEGIWATELRLMFPMSKRWFGGNQTTKPLTKLAEWNRDAMSLEYVNYALALLVFIIRYPSVFWHTCRPFSGIFSLQLFFMMAQNLLTYSGFCVLYKSLVNRHIMMPNVEFCLSPAGVVILFLIANAILFIQNISMFEYGYHYYVMSRRKYKERYHAARNKTERMPLMGCQGYIPHTVAMSMMVVSMIFKAAINYDEGMIYRVYSDKLLLACIIMDVVYLLFWIVLWFALTIKQNWQFRLDPPLWIEDESKNGGVFTISQDRPLLKKGSRKSCDSFKDSEIGSSATLETDGFSSNIDILNEDESLTNTPNAAKRHSFPSGQLRPILVNNPNSGNSRSGTPVPDVAQSTMNLTSTSPNDRIPTPYNSMPTTPESSNPATPCLSRSQPTTPNLRRPHSRPATPSYSRPTTPNLPCSTFSSPTAQHMHGRSPSLPNVQRPISLHRPMTPSLSRPTTPLPAKSPKTPRDGRVRRKRAGRVTFEGIHIPFSDTDDKGSESGNESSGSSLEDIPPKLPSKMLPKLPINNLNSRVLAENKLVNSQQQQANGALGALNQQVRCKLQRNNSKCSADYDNPYTDNYMNYSSLPRTMTKKQTNSLPGGRGSVKNDNFRHSMREKNSDYYELKELEDKTNPAKEDYPDSVVNTPIPLMNPLKVNVHTSRTRPMAESPLYGETGNPSSDSGIEMPDGRSVSPNYSKSPVKQFSSIFNPNRRFNDSSRDNGNYATLAALEEMKYPHQETAEERETRLLKEKEAKLCSQV